MADDLGDELKETLVGVFGASAFELPTRWGFAPGESKLSGGLEDEGPYVEIEHVWRGPEGRLQYAMLFAATMPDVESALLAWEGSAPEADHPVNEPIYGAVGRLETNLWWQPPSLAEARRTNWAQPLRVMYWDQDRALYIACDVMEKKLLDRRYFEPLGRAIGAVRSWLS